MNRSVLHYFPLIHYFKNAKFTLTASACTTFTIRNTRCS